MVRVTRFTLLMLVLLLAGAYQPLPLTAAIVTQSPPLLLSQTVTVVTPQFLRTACLYRIPPDANVTCGYLLVPEDRSQPTSKTIRLHVVIFKSRTPAPAADPLILLNGGPGSAGQPMVEAMLYDLVGEVWRAERDLIYFDQRGTGFSLPSLYCPESAMPEAIVATMSYTMSIAADSAAMHQCYTRLRDEGINLAAYNLAESAADINDLRVALGYDQVNLYGFSYGSLLAAAVVRNDPTAIRSVVLDAVLPPGINLLQEKPHCLQSAFDALFAGCAADPACHAAYPDLEHHFYATLERLHGAPVMVPITALGQRYAVVMDDLKFLNHLLTQLQRGLISPLPRQIEAAFGGNYEAPAKQWLAYAAAQATPASRLRAATAYGMYYSTLCNYTAGLTAAAAQAPVPCPTCSTAPEPHPSLATYAGFSLSACAFWQAGAAPANLTGSLPSDSVPTLRLTGAYDGALAPYLSQPAGETANTSYHFVLPVGHAVVASPCGLHLTAQFLADPLTQPNATCIAQMAVNWSTR